MIDEKWTIKRILWFSLGMLSLGMAYIGVVTPGIPFSIFLVIAAYSFARSSKKWHDWIYNHKYFGPFLTNWVNYRVFPFYAKISMIIVMSSTLIFTWYMLHNLNMILWTGGFMLSVAIWAWRYPSTREEHTRRVENSEKIGWIH